MPETNTDMLGTGENFQTVSGSYRITHKLGSGATGEVYAAESVDGRRVAIKLMRESSSAQEKKLFMGEAFVLARMQIAEKEAADGWSVAPAYYGADDQSRNLYLVEEMMEGTRLPDYLAAVPRLPETEALELAAQLFRTLELLHTGRDLKKSYIDLKLENLWWLPEKQSLKITDWGTLEEVNPEGVDRDILRGSLYLFRILTGRIVTETRGVPDQMVEDFAEWNDLSRGLKEILRRLLHRNPAVRRQEFLIRLQTAGQVAQALKNLLDDWRTPAPEILEKSERLLKTALKVDKVELQSSLFLNISSQLDIASRLPAVDRQVLQRMLEQVESNSNYFTRAKTLYAGTSYNPARHLFKQGAKLLWSSQLRRWAVLASIGVEEGAAGYLPAAKAQAERAVELMEQTQPEALVRFSEAGTLLAQAYLELPSARLEALRQECLVFQNIATAVTATQKGEYAQAAQYYQSAQAIWEEIPEHEEWLFEIGDLKENALNMRLKAESASWAEALAQQAWKTSQEKSEVLSDDVFALIRDALNLDPGNERVWERIQALAKVFLGQGALEKTCELLFVAGSSPIQPPYARDWSAPETLRRLLQAGSSLKDMALYVTGISSNPDSPARQAAIRLLVTHFGIMQAAGAVERSAEVIDMLRVLDNKLASQLSEALDKRMVKMINDDNARAQRLIAEASSRLAVNSIEGYENLSMGVALKRLTDRISEIEKVEEILHEAGLYVDPQDQSLVSERNRLVGLAEQTKKIWVNRQAERVNQNAVSLQNNRQIVETLLERMENLESTLAGFSKVVPSPELAKNLDVFTRQLLGEAQLHLQYMLRIEPDNQWTVETEMLITDRIKLLGEDSARLVYAQQLEKQLGVSDLLREAEKALQRLDSLQAGDILKKVEPFVLQSQAEQFNSLKQNFIALQGALEWEVENQPGLVSNELNASLLGAIGSQPGKNLPAMFWKKSASLEYLHNLNSTLLEKVVESGIEPFARSLRNLVWVNNLYRQAQGLANGEPARYGEAFDAPGFCDLILRAKAGKNFRTELLTILNLLPWFKNPELKSAEITPEVVDRTAQALKKQIALGRNLMFGAFGVIGVLVLALLVFWGLKFFGSPSQASVDETAAAAVLVINTEIPTPTETVTPEPATATVTPTQTETPTPLPLSKYALGNVTLTPVVLGAYYPDSNMLELAKPIADVTTGSAEWVSDVDLSAGLYGIYVFDSKSGSGGSLKFEVMSGESVLAPVVGSAELGYSSSTSIVKQADDTWKMLGIYEMPKNGLLSVKTDWTAQSFVTLNRILVARLPDSTRNLLSALLAVPGRKPDGRIYVADNTAILDLPIASMLKPGPGWMDDFAIVAPNTASPVKLSWSLPEMVADGKYKLLVYLPKVANPSDLEISLQLVSDGKLLGTPFKLVQSEQVKTLAESETGKWVEIDLTGNDVKASDIASPKGMVTMTVELTIPSAASGQIMIDAVALVEIN